MLSLELKESTEYIHKEAENIMIRLLKKIRTKEHYVQLLNWLYGYYGPLEELIKSQLTIDLFPEVNKRSRADDILRDMEAANIPLPTPRHCFDLPEIDTYGKALGALYVVEGSTLGGKIIAGMMARQLGSDQGLAYFSSYGKETADMWQSFKAFLDNPFPPQVKEDILSAANATFITFKTWIERHAFQPQL